MLQDVVILKSLTQRSAWITDCDSHGPALLYLFFLKLVFILQWLSFP